MRSIWPRKVASALVRAVAHDPPKCERFGDKIMRPLKKKSAIGRKTGDHFC
jgi:hypothetical protein